MSATAEGTDAVIGPAASHRTQRAVELSKGGAAGSPALAKRSTIAKPKGIKKASKKVPPAAAGRICADCNANATVQWRRIDAVWYCNACGCSRKRREQKVRSPSSVKKSEGEPAGPKRNRVRVAIPKVAPTGTVSEDDQFVAPKTSSRKKPAAHPDAVASQPQSEIDTPVVRSPQQQADFEEDEMDAMTKMDPNFSGLMDVANMEFIASQRMSPSSWREASPVDPQHPVAWMLRHPPYGHNQSARPPPLPVPKPLNSPSVYAEQMKQLESNIRARTSRGGEDVETPLATPAASADFGGVGEEIPRHHFAVVSHFSPTASSMRSSRLSELEAPSP